MDLENGRVEAGARRKQEGLVFTELDEVGVPHQANHGAMRDQRSFRYAGGTRSIENAGGFVGFQRGAGKGSASLAVAGEAIGREGGEAFRKPIDPSRLADRERGTTVGDEEVESVEGILGIERHAGGAAFHRRVERGDRVGRTLEKESDAAAVLHSGGGQAVGDLIDPGSEVGIPHFPRLGAQGDR